jgi:hypothetical protein
LVVNTAVLVVKLLVVWCVLSVPLTLVVAYCMRVGHHEMPARERAVRTPDVAARPRYANG